MTTHEGHDHPNTKAGRAACRKAGMASVTDLTTRINRESVEEQASKARHPSSKKRAPKRKADPSDPSMPHAYDEDMERPNRCYICKRSEGASVHTEGPRDLAGLLTFGSVRTHHRSPGYTTGQAATVLGITVKELKRAVMNGDLTPTETSGGHRRFDPAEVDRYRVRLKLRASHVDDAARRAATRIED